MKLLAIHMTPVKCCRLHSLESSLVGPRGLRGDRDFVLLDKDRQPISSSRHGLFLPLQFNWDPAANLLTLEFPDGKTVSRPLELCKNRLSIDYMRMRKIWVREVAGPWNELLKEFSGRPVSLVKTETSGDGIDVLPLSLVTTASLAELSKWLGKPVDPRRFRSNLIIEGGPAHIEDQWDGQLLQVGDATLKVRSSIPRCSVTNLDPDSGLNNAKTVAALLRYREKVHLPNSLMPDYATPGFGSYAEVLRPSSVHVNDTVTLLK